MTRLQGSSTSAETAARRRLKVLAQVLGALLVLGSPASAQDVTRVSVSSAGGQATGGPSEDPSISADGRFVAFSSEASNLVPGDTNAVSDIFVRDRVTGATSRVSVASDGAQATGGPSYAPYLSADGRVVVFTSRATNLAPGGGNAHYQVFAYDRTTGTTTRASRATDGGLVDSGTDQARVSADGRFVAYSSDATNIVSGDSNGFSDVYLFDRQTNTTTRVSVATGGAQAVGGASGEPSISADNRYVAFASNATNLVSGDTNAAYDVFVHDRTTATTSRVSVLTGGGQVSGDSYEPRISADGRYVAFYTPAAFVADDTNFQYDVYVHDRVNGTTARVSVVTGGGEAVAPGGSGSESPTISADGRYVLFESDATNLVAADGNGDVDIFVHDRTTGVTTLISVGLDATPAAGGSFNATVSGDGRYVAFDADGAGLVTSDTNGQADVFVRDWRRFQRTRVSVTSGGTQASGGLWGVSATGRFVTLTSNATNLVPSDTNGVSDAFVHDRVTGNIERVSVATGGAQANGPSGTVQLSADGRYAAFASDATTLVPGDTNAARDVFVRDRQTGVTERLSSGTAGAQSNANSDEPTISADGRFVAFVSDATNLVSGDTNSAADIFVQDRVLGVTTRVSLSTSGGQALGGHSAAPSMSADGRLVAFVSWATNLVTGDTNNARDVFVHDRASGTTTRVSVSSAGVEHTGSFATFPQVSADGTLVAFESNATNLVPSDSNGVADVFVHELATGVTTRVSVADDGAQAVGASESGAVSGDGRYILFVSQAANLVPFDTNGVADVFLRDRLLGTTTRVSAGPNGVQATGGASQFAALSADGRVIAFQSLATNLVPDDTNGLVDVFVRAERPVLSYLTPAAGSTTGGTTVQIVGVGFLPGSTATVAGQPALHVDGATTNLLSLTTPPGTAGFANISVSVPSYEPQGIFTSFRYVTPPTSTTTDTDGDGLPDGYELQYSLDPLQPTTANADPDGDGQTTLAEQSAGTHPRGSFRRYLAEGATGSFFNTALALMNPTDGQATVVLRYLPAVGSPVAQLLMIPPRTRRTVDVGSVPGMTSAEFSTVLESDRPVVLDRVMTWDSGKYGSHAETALIGPSTEWYLAEGATHSGFDLFYLLQNPATTATTVQVTFLRPAPLPPIVRSYSLAPQSRFNVWVDQADPALAATDVSAQINASQPIVVERAMYLSTPGRLFTAGHESAGVTAPATSWFLAEGATGPYFDLFVLLVNPNTSTAAVTATYLKADGSTVTKTYTVAGKSRFNIWVDQESAALADTAVSTTIHVTNGVPIVVERAMWWPGSAATWQEAHNSPGSTAVGRVWATASGEVGGPTNAEAYLLIANTAVYAATVRVSIYFEDGTVAAKVYTVPKQTRFNVSVRSEFPSAEGKRFSALIESIGLGEAPLAVEQALYGDHAGVTWQAGASALGTNIVR